MAHSKKKKVIFESFITKGEQQICGDGVIYNGKVKYFFPGIGITYKKSFVPLAEAFPLNSNEKKNKIINNINLLISKTKIDNCFFNIDILIKNEQIYIIEFAPRLGGNFICDAIKYSTNFNLIDIDINQKLPKKNPSIKKNFFILNGMLHSKKNKIFKKFKIKKYENNIISKEILCLKNQLIKSYSSRSQTYGNIILKFKSKKKFINAVKNSPKIFCI